MSALTPQTVAPRNLGKQADGWVTPALQEDGRSLVLAAGNRRTCPTCEPELGCCLTGHGCLP